MSENSSNLPVAGWYPDPERAGEDRWWNGAAWSDERRGSAATPAASASASPAAAPIVTPAVSERPNPYAAPGVVPGAVPGATPYSTQYVAPTNTNPLALAGLITSGASLLLGLLIPFIGFFGLVTGIVLSGIGLSRAKALEAQGVAASGRGLALGGLITGIAGLALTVLVGIGFALLFAAASFS